MLVQQVKEKVFGVDVDGIRIELTAEEARRISVILGAGLQQSVLAQDGFNIDHASRGLAGKLRNELERISK